MLGDNMSSYLKQCVRCRVRKQLSEFGRRRNDSPKLKSACDKCISKTKIYNRSKMVPLYHARKSQGLCVRCGIEAKPESSLCEEHCNSAANRNRTSLRERVPQYKKAVFDHYGRKCECCGETEQEFLQIDHVYGGGCIHYKSARQMYRWLCTHGFPLGFQTLCASCNWARRSGNCPHFIEKHAEHCKTCSASAS